MLLCLSFATCARSRLLKVTTGSELCGADVDRWNRYWPSSRAETPIECRIDTNATVPAVPLLDGRSTWALMAREGEFDAAVSFLVTGSIQFKEVTWAALAAAPAGHSACNTTCGPGLQCISGEPGVCAPKDILPDKFVCFSGAHSTCAELRVNGVAAAVGVAAAFLYATMAGQTSQRAADAAAVAVGGSNSGRLEGDQTVARRDANLCL